MTSEMRDEPCVRVGRYFGGCKFEPRYDYGESGAIKIKGTSENLVDVLNASKKQTYVGDICVRCGKWKVRP